MSELRILTAESGMVYTNGDVYGKEIYLGVNDAEENWYQVPESEVPSDADEPAMEADYLDALAKLGVR